MHLNSTVDENKIDLNGYSFHKSNHPQDVKRGGVGLYVKESLPARRRPGLEAQPECVVCEIKLNRKKYFIAVLYRIPRQTQVESEGFRKNFELMLSKMSAEKPFSVIITGDFNCRSTQWWDGEFENEEGRIFEPFTADLGLNQLISEPTHIMGESKSCNDLVLRDQPNLFLESSVHPPLDELCHHHIT